MDQFHHYGIGGEGLDLFVSRSLDGVTELIPQDGKIEDKKKSSQPSEEEFARARAEDLGGGTRLPPYRLGQI